MRTVLALMLLSCATTAQTELARGFTNPPASARPHTWWHWMNGNVTREGITADLEAMQRAGIGGAQIFNVSEQIPLGPAPFMSPQWLELLAHAAEEARRVGIELCFHNCAGWSSSGGPWVEPEHAMQVIVVSEAHAQGPARFTDVLPQPPTRRDHYRDIAVLAFPTPGDDKWRLPDWRTKAGFESSYGLTPSEEAAPPGAAVARETIVDLSGKLAADGHLVWDVPAGAWTILRIGHTPTGKENHPAPDAGRGLECDKLSREALDDHWEGGIEPILTKLGPLAGSTVNQVLIDSYEVGCNNWTPRMPAEFAARRGYDPLPFLVTLTGRIVGDVETSERFLWDFRRTIADLFADNYFGWFAERCRQRGLLAAIEPYDGPFECLAVAARADIVMGEFWVGSGEPASCKLAAAVAHTHGQQIVGAESFTAVPERGRWQNHPGSLKALGDLIWCSGVNRFIFHRYAHQPWLDLRPGMTMGQWGTHFERTNTWWEQSRAWTDYLARAQFLLQQGRSVADVLFFGGEGAPSGGVHRPDLKARGYDYDALGTDLVAELRVRDGNVELPSGARYRLLVLPDSPYMTPALARRIRDLVAGGATVIAPKPRRSPSLADRPTADLEVARIAQEVWGDGAAPVDRSFGEGRIVSGQAPEALLAAMGLAPDFEALTPDARVAFIHRRTVDAEIFFVSNQKARAQTIECAFRVAGREPELWDAESAQIERAAIWRADGDRTVVPLRLEAAGSVFVVFRRPAPADAIVAMHHEARPTPATKPAHDLVIRRARYGVLSLARLGMVDVTKELALLTTEHLRVRASNALAGDPAPNVVKQLRVHYEQAGEPHTKTVREGEMLVLPEGDGTGALRILRAVYGLLPTHPLVVPEVRFVDVTDKLATLIEDGTLMVTAGNTLGGDPIPNVRKELEVEFELDGVAGQVRLAEGERLELPAAAWQQDPPAPHLSRADDGTLSLLAWDGGRYDLRRADGSEQHLEGPRLPADLPIEGAWDVSFPPGGGAPARVTFETLMSWPERPEDGVRYFAGTAIYRKTVTLPPLDENRVLVLDLGQVRELAEVRLNGHDLGILWRRPFRVDITGAAQPGDNRLEVRVTNLWPNRLIGDEQHPDDCEWNGQPLARWPAWLLDGTPRPVPERLTFTTWKHWSAASPLLPSGLLGPVTVRTAARVAVPR